MANTASAEELMQRIAAEYDTLSKQLKVIAGYVEQHRGTLMLQRITDIAQACEVQPSAIVRFAQRFGFAGFSDMQALFRDAFTPQGAPQPNYRQRIQSLIANRDEQRSAGGMTRDFIAACQQGLQELDASLDEAQLEAAVELLLNADNIYVAGVRRMFPIASYIAYALQHTAKKVHLLSGLGGMFPQQIRSIGEKDVLIAISFQPYGKESRYCARVAAQHKAKQLVITDSQLSPLARGADAVLTVREGSAFAFRSLTSTICLCQALFIALACRLELNIEETKETGGYDD
ncbi:MULTISPECIES: MurR/RpiR family transcriptional regulator [Chromobacterium]|uniref:MurR/RpiR family transcriptional regulator n=1 Tax=Chromobacterium rhizoryzae TaxID=1778675 RepID=A0AAD0RRX7_9NEIS|nr:MULTISPECIES: MurR/RpiR family transcriptional regulator [Chromobacterium]AXT47480.1 MurR/RpiR family transcriptional regulator [Chromobacterium rhizoryzae]OQS32529.1 MurR/RpiR family transcriptional regulator [Chromobacterium haemolyticum]PTU69096.1 MurR/RpiR family transcriptional regulator [Chromobacterium haemolyticum]QOD81319.1 MurR/RpiR family transcriptional regulator [Chromobacterium haemolyticum]